MKHRLAWIIAATLLSAALTPVLAAPSSASSPFSFGVIGDTPYGDTALAKFPQRIAEINADPDVQIIDVREVAELSTGMIEDAVHIPSGEIVARAAELDKSRRIIAVCHGGGRSGRVAEALTALGFNADTLVGGMSGWEAEGLPMVPPEA